MPIAITEEQHRVVETIVQTGFGTASVCWIPKPAGVFQGEAALRAADTAIKQLYDTLGITVLRKESTDEPCLPFLR